MKILIIGSRGFIGSNCVSYFQEGGYDVWGADVVTDYNTSKYILLDSSNADFHEIFEQNQFDVCLNCSGAASVSDSLKHPLRDYLLNTSNVYQMLDAIRRFNLNCKFINLSSAAVYGNPDQLPVKENAHLNPLSPYGVHKKMAEDISREFHQHFGVKTCSLRIFSAYGDGLKKQLFWDLYKKSKTGNRIELFGSGNESRDFIYIQDILEALHILITKALFKSEVYNLANGEEIFIKDAVEAFYKALGWNGKVVFTGKQREGDPDNWLADISKIKALGFKSAFDLSLGLGKYVTWLRENG